MHYLLTLRSEKGSALLIAVFILFIMTILGISATTTSNLDIEIASNDRRYVQEFYVADSGWKGGVTWLNNRSAHPVKVNISTPGDTVVRNYGNGGDGEMRDTTLPADGALNNLPYWYEVAQQGPSSIVPGSGKGYRDFNYSVTSSGNQTQEIGVIIAKVFKVGY